MTPKTERYVELLTGALVAALGFTGCGVDRLVENNPDADVISPGGASSSTGGATGAGGTSAVNALPSGPISLAALSQCTASPQGVRAYTSLGDFQSAIFGDWGLCKAPSVFGTNEVGLEITADGRWHKLSAAGGQTASIATGWGNEGPWQIIDTSSMNGPGSYQLNLTIDGSGTVLTQPQISISPVMMRLNNMGVYIGDYIRLGP